MLLDGSISHSAVARHLGVNETSVRRYRRKHKVFLLAPEAPSASYAATHSAEDTEPQKGTVEVDKDGATLNNVVVESPILDDWGPVFKLFNLDPDEFEVVDDTVRMSTWQQSKRLENGERDTIQLWSYSARFRRVNKDMIPALQIREWREAILDSDIMPPEVDYRHLANAICTTYVMLIADPQLGKKGTEEAVHNWKRGVRGHLRQLRVLQEQGHYIERIHVAFQGDEHENVVNSYTNQPHTIELNRNAQLELDFDLSLWTFREVFKTGLPVSASSVISNHGLWTRNDSKDPVTTNNDNSSTYIRRQVKKFFDELEPYTRQHIDWTIGDDTPGVVVDLSGVPSYFSHGFIEKGKGGTTEAKVQNAVEQQILGDTSRLGKVPLWFMAHYHHFYTNEFQDRTLFGCPALEALKSSEYMKDQYGVWSLPGMLGLLVGHHTERRFSDINIY